MAGGKSSGKAAPSGEPAKDSGKATPNPNFLKCKAKRTKLYQSFTREKKLEKKKRRESNKKEAEETGVKKAPKTIESTRIADETFVAADDEEVMGDQLTDELAGYFNGQRPKILVTTSEKAVGSGTTFKFCEELINLMPDAEFYPRRNFTLKEIVQYAKNREFTDVLVVNEDKKTPNAMILTHLPDGPTAHFKVSSVKLNKEIKGHGRGTNHFPELILNNFNTRLAHTLGRMFAALFPQQPEFLGRQVVTFHNQRDFIFFRQHRYIFKDGKRVGLQEIGPRFTLKLRSLQKGTFDSKFGEFEFVHNRKQMEKSRRKFLL